MKKIGLYLILLITLFSSCGYSVVTFTDNSKPCAVYINKKYEGMSNNRIKFQTSGLPQKKLIEVKDSRGKLITSQNVSREFKVLKFLVGFCYFYPIWFFMWEYDKKIVIDNHNYGIQNKYQDESPWDTDSLIIKKSPWD